MYIEQQQSHLDHIVMDIELQPKNIIGDASSQLNAVDVLKPLRLDHGLPCRGHEHTPSRQRHW